MAHVRITIRAAIEAAVRAALPDALVINESRLAPNAEHIRVTVGAVEQVERRSVSPVLSRRIDVRIGIYATHHDAVADRLDATAVTLENAFEARYPLGITGVSMLYEGATMDVVPGSSGDAARLELQYSAMVSTSGPETISS